MPLDGTDNEPGQVVTGTGEPAPLATEPQGVTDPQLATGKGEPTPPATETEKSVPYDRFKEVNDAKRAAEERNQFYEEQLRAMQSQQLPQQAAQQQPDLLADLGVDPDDIYTPEGVRKLVGGVDRLVNQRVRQATQQMEQQQFFTSHPDFGELVGTSVGGRFVPSETWRQIQRENPTLAHAIESSPNASVIAYEHAKRVRQAQPPADTTGRQLVNQVRQMSGATTQGVPSITQAVGSGTMDKISQIKGMTDAQFEAYKDQIKARGGAQ